MHGYTKPLWSAVKPMSLTVTELAEEVRESNRRLTQAIDNLSRRLEDLRLEISKDLGTINANLESFKGRVDSEMGIAKWAAKVLTPAVFTLIASAVGGAWYLAKVDSRLDTLVKQTSQVEVRQSPPDKSIRSPVPAPIPGLDPSQNEPKAVPDAMAPKSKVVPPPVDGKQPQ